MASTDCQSSTGAGLPERSGSGLQARGANGMRRSAQSPRGAGKDRTQNEIQAVFSSCLGSFVQTHLREATGPSTPDVKLGELLFQNLWSCCFCPEDPNGSCDIAGERHSPSSSCRGQLPPQGSVSGKQIAAKDEGAGFTSWQRVDRVSVCRANRSGIFLTKYALPGLLHVPSHRHGLQKRQSS